jgi:hypothetical protein
MTILLLFLVYAIAVSMALAGAGHWGSSAAAASVNGWLGTMQGSEVAKFRELVTHARQQLARAKELAPANSRVVWVEAMTLSGTPVAYGGHPERALQILRESLEAGVALQLQPEWFYVREILTPRIQDAQRKAAGSSEQPH